MLALTIMPQVDQFLWMKLFSAEGAFHLSVTPLSDALPAEEVATGCSCSPPALLQAQGTHGTPTHSLLFHMALAVGEAAVEFPLLVCPLPLTEAVDLDADGEQEMQQGYQTQNPIAPTNAVVIPREAAHAKL